MGDRHSAHLLRLRPPPASGKTRAGENCELAAAEGLDVTKWGIAADARTLATNLEGVFAGGDAVLGPDLAVRAVAAGRLAAVSIDQYLTGQPVAGEEKATNILMRGLDEEEMARVRRIGRHIYQKA